MSTNGYATIEISANPPGMAPHAIYLNAPTEIEFWVRFAYVSPLTGKWAYVPAGIDAWIFAGEPGTTVGDKVPTAAAPAGTHLKGPKPSNPADIGIAIEFGANKAIDPQTNTLVDLEEGKLLVPVPEQWTSIAAFSSEGGKMFFKNCKDALKQGSEKKPCDVMLPTQTFFFTFGFPIPPDAVEIFGHKGVPLAPGTADGRFFDVLYGPMTEENHFKWKVTLTEENEKFDKARNALCRADEGDPDGEYVYLRRESDNSAIEFPKGVINGHPFEPFLQDVPLLKNPEVAEGKLEVDGAPAANTDIVIVTAGGKEIPAKTDGDGAWRVEKVPPGEYKLKLKASGDAPWVPPEDKEDEELPDQPPQPDEPWTPPDDNEKPGDDKPPEPTPPELDEVTFEAQLVGADGKPRADVAFELQMPDGKSITGASTAEGLVKHVARVPAGDWKLVLPEIDKTLQGT